MDAYFMKGKPEVAAKKLDEEMDAYKAAKAAAKPKEGEEAAAAE